jgi:uncharacterized protein YjbJ (UPF0337 family)
MALMVRCGDDSMPPNGVTRHDHDKRSKEQVMSAVDKAKNKVEDLGGHAKEAVGSATGDKDTENEGKVDQVKANLKDAGEKVKDAFK